MRGLLTLLLALFSLAASAGQLQQLQLLGGPEGVRAVFGLDTNPSHHVFTLRHPDRLVVDLDDTAVAARVRNAEVAAGIVRSVRYGRHGRALRVVFDLRAPAQAEAFTMRPGGGYGNRLIVEIKPSPVSAHAPAVILARPKPRSVVPPPVVAASRRFIVAIDPGHGGDDSGARGPNGLMEKTVTLAVARRLARQVDAQPGMRAVLTRDGDYYVGLRQRMVIARKANADIFISIHCNAVRDRSVRGTEVYVLSNRGASSEQARWVANRENAADLVGGVDISDKSTQLASVLLDISQSATLDASFDLANRLMRTLGGMNPLLHPVVQRAAFVVLKAPDIPSVLVETAFISNPREEHLLGSPDYQERLAQFVFSGIRGYDTQYRPRQSVPLQTARRGSLQSVGVRAPED